MTHVCHALLVERGSARHTKVALGMHLRRTKFWTIGCDIGRDVYIQPIPFAVYSFLPLKRFGNISNGRLGD